MCILPLEQWNGGIERLGSMNTLAVKKLEEARKRQLAEAPATNPATITEGQSQLVEQAL